MKYSKPIKALSLSLVFCTLLSATPTHAMGSALLQKVKTFFTAKNQADRLMFSKNITIFGTATIVTGIVLLAVKALFSKKFRDAQNSRNAAKRRNIKIAKRNFQNLIEAAKRGDINTAQDLIDNKGVAVNACSYANKNCRSHLYINDLNPLHAAVIRGHLKFTKMLLKKGAYIDAKWYTETDPDPKNAKTALLAALESGHGNVAKMLIRKGADFNIAADNSYETPLHMAAKKGYIPIVKLLLDKGADIEATTIEHYETPLHKAAAAGNTNTVKTLIERGANIEAERYDFKTPWQLAIDYRHMETIDMLNRYRLKKALHDNRFKKEFKLGSVDFSKS